MFRCTVYMICGAGEVDALVRSLVCMYVLLYHVRMLRNGSFKLSLFFVVFYPLSWHVVAWRGVTWHFMCQDAAVAAVVPGSHRRVAGGDDRLLRLCQGCRQDGRRLGSVQRSGTADHVLSNV